jgi:hypothetical protein
MAESVRQASREMELTNSSEYICGKQGPGAKHFGKSKIREGEGG